MIFNDTAQLVHRASSSSCFIDNFGRELWNNKITKSDLNNGIKSQISIFSISIFFEQLKLIDESMIRPS